MTEMPTTGSRDPDQSVDDETPASGTTTTPQEDASAPQETASSEAARPAEHEDLLARTRASETWIAIIVFALVLILLLIFILENTKKVEISYFGVTGHLPLAVAMLLSAVAGVLLTAIAGTLRILQLRRRVRRGQAGA